MGPTIRYVGVAVTRRPLHVRRLRPLEYLRHRPPTPGSMRETGHQLNGAAYSSLAVTQDARIEHG